MLALTAATPAAADGFGVMPRLGLSLVVEDGPLTSGGLAVGISRSVGLAVGWEAISLVGELGWRDASIPSGALSKGWDVYETSDRTWSVGLRSMVPLDPAWDLAFELHVGESRAENRAEGTRDIYVAADGEYFTFWGAAAEGLWSPTGGWNLGVRAGFDDFSPQGRQGFDGGGGQATVDYERVSWSFGPVVGWRFD